MSYLDVNPVINTYRYLQGRQLPSARYASWDHCYNYFTTALEEGWQSELARPEHLQTSCLQLGFYLASWGMYRGKAALLKQSSQGLAEVVKVAAETNASIWNIDVENYSEESIRDLLNVSRKIRNALPGGATDTLVTKVMLGVYGNVPAFDRFFRSGFGSFSLGVASLEKVKTYFDSHKNIIAEVRPETIDFQGNPTGRFYTQAKVIDMVFFVEGGGLTVG
jgi:hypothetical protein